MTPIKSETTACHSGKSSSLLEILQTGKDHRFLSADSGVQQEAEVENRVFEGLGENLEYGF